MIVPVTKANAGQDHNFAPVGANACAVLVSVTKFREEASTKENFAKTARYLIEIKWKLVIIIVIVNTDNPQTCRCSEYVDCVEFLAFGLGSAQQCDRKNISVEVVDNIQGNFALCN